MPRRHRGGISRSDADSNSIVYPFAGDRSVRITQTGLDVGRTKVRVFPEDGLRRVARRERAEHMFHGDAEVSNDGLSAENVRSDRNSIQKLELWPKVGDGMIRRRRGLRSRPAGRP